MIPKKYLVKKSRQEIEPQEVFLDSLAQKKQGEAKTREMKFEVPPPKTNLAGFLAFSLVIFLVLFLKTFQFTVIDGKTYGRLADLNFSRISPIRADRGIIYDQSFAKLVSNVPSFDLVLDIRDLLKNGQRNQEIQTIAKIIKKDTVILEKEIENSKQEKLLVAENLDHETLVLLETKINDLPGFQIEKNTVRDYFEGSFFSQVLGYNGRINPQEFGVS